MATFFAPQPTYKAPTFQELAAPLLLYREAYNDMEQKYDAQREKNAMLQAMLGSDPDNEISQYMADYNALMDETARGFSNGTLPYAQLYGNYRKLRDIWNDKGVKMTAAIDSFTKYKDARSKMPGAIGPEYTLWDFHKNPNLSYSFFSPDDIYKAGALSGAAYAQQKGPRNGRPAPNGQWIDEYGPTNDEVATAFTDSNNPFYNDANSIMQQYGIDPNSDNAALFRNAYQRGLASSQKLVPSHNVDYINAYQRYQRAKQDKAERKMERLENMQTEAWNKRPPTIDIETGNTSNVTKLNDHNPYKPDGSDKSYPIYSWDWGTPTEPHYAYGYFDDGGEFHFIDEKALVRKGRNGSTPRTISGIFGSDTTEVDVPLED